MNGQRLAVAFAHRLLPFAAPGFRGRIEAAGDGIVVTLGKHIGFVPRFFGDVPTGTGLAQRTPVTVGASGALAVLVASLFRLDSDSQGRTLVASTDTLFTPQVSVSASEWLGFLRLRRGWLGVAAANSPSQDYLNFAITSDHLLSRRAADAARYLQDRGIAAMPAIQARSTPTFDHPDRPTTGGGLRQLLHAVHGGSLETLLHAVRILDLGRVIAGPFAAEILGLLGARVCSVRPPGYGARFGGGDEIDLRTEAGQAQLRAALADADLVVENFRPRGWAQLIPPATAALVQRRVALRGFPTYSPFANWKLFGFLVEGAFGVGPVPATCSRSSVRASGVPLWDRVVGVVGAAVAVSLLKEGKAMVEVSQVGLARSLSALEKQFAARSA